MNSLQIDSLAVAARADKTEENNWVIVLLCCYSVFDHFLSTYSANRYTHTHKKWREPFNSVEENGYAATTRPSWWWIQKDKIIKWEIRIDFRRLFIQSVLPRSTCACSFLIRMQIFYFIFFCVAFTLFCVATNWMNRDQGEKISNSIS